MFEFSLITLTLPFVSVAGSYFNLQRHWLYQISSCLILKSQRTYRIQAVRTGLVIWKNSGLSLQRPNEALVHMHLSPLLCPCFSTPEEKKVTGLRARVSIPLSFQQPVARQRLGSFQWDEASPTLCWQLSPRAIVGKHTWTAYPNNNTLL